MAKCDWYHCASFPRRLRFRERLSRCQVLDVDLEWVYIGSTLAPSEFEDSRSLSLSLLLSRISSVSPVAFILIRSEFQSNRLLTYQIFELENRFLSCFFPPDFVLSLQSGWLEIQPSATFFDTFFPPENTFYPYSSEKTFQSERN